jgi:hypothetical protein
MSADEIAAAHDVMLERMDAEFGTLKRLEALVAAAEAAFPGAAGAKEMDPAAAADAAAAEAEAAENAQVTIQNTPTSQQCQMYQGKPLHKVLLQTRSQLFAARPDVIAFHVLSRRELCVFGAMPAGSPPVSWVLFPAAAPP